VKFLIVFSFTIYHAETSKASSESVILDDIEQQPFIKTHFLHCCFSDVCFSNPVLLEKNKLEL